MTARLQPLTGLRGVAACAVLVFHAYLLYTVSQGWGAGQYVPGLSLGWIGVDFFFVLSAFLLALPLVDRPAAWLATGFWGRYLARRWLRIAPAYYVSIPVALLLAGNLAYLSSGRWDVLAHLAYVHTFDYEWFASINPVYWTLALEFQLYLLLPVVVWLLAGRRAAPAAALLVGAGLAWRFVTYDAATGSWLSFQLPGFLPHLALGVVAARLHRAGVRAPATVPLAAGALLVAALAAFTVPGSPSQGGDRLLPNLLLRPLLSVGFAALTWWAAGGAAGTGLLASRPLRWLGDASYSLYLVHLPVLLVVAPLGFVTSNGFAAYLGLTLGASLAATAAYYAVVERPLLRARDLLLTPRPARVEPPLPRASAAVAAVGLLSPAGGPRGPRRR